MLNASTDPRTNVAGDDSLGFWGFSTLVLVLAACFLLLGLNWGISQELNHVLKPDEIEDAVAANSGNRYLAYAALALLGTVMLAWPTGRRVRYQSCAMLLMLGHWAICAASVLWSDDPSLTLRRLGVLAFCMLPAFGVMRHVSVRSLLDLAIIILVLTAGIGLFAELSQGTFRPWSDEYRFAGTMHPNEQGAFCAILVMACWFAAGRGDRRRWLYIALLLAGITLLWLTKSRTGLAACLVSLSVTWYVSTSGTSRVFAGLGLPVALAAVFIAALLGGLEVASGLDEAAKLGRSGLDAGVASLNGRVPLWAELLDYQFAERPWLGYGYRAFWTPERIVEISAEHEWTIPHAHSVYIDTLLGVGLIGAAPLLLAVIACLVRSVRASLSRPDPDNGFVLAVLVFAMTEAFLETGIALPTRFDTFIVACCVIYLATLPRSRSASGAEPRAWPATGAPGVREEVPCM